VAWAYPDRRKVASTYRLPVEAHYQPGHDDNYLPAPAGIRPHCAGAGQPCPPRGAPAGRYGSSAPATFNRNLATIGSLFAWAVQSGHLATSPASGPRRREERRSRTQELQANAIPYAEL
jgi:hypothetical protein